MADPRREYGLQPTDHMTRGAPRVGQRAGIICPYCRCDTLFHIEVDVENPLLRGGKGVGNYVGCPACPFASPMVMRASGGE